MSKVQSHISHSRVYADKKSINIQAAYLFLECALFQIVTKSLLRSKGHVETYLALAYLHHNQVPFYCLLQRSLVNCLIWSFLGSECPVCDRPEDTECGNRPSVLSLLLFVPWLTSERGNSSVGLGTGLIWLFFFFFFYIHLTGPAPETLPVMLSVFT